MAYLLVYPHEPRVADVTWSMILLLGGSATLGIVIQALALVPFLRTVGFTYRPRWGFRGVGLRSASTVVPSPPRCPSWKIHTSTLPKG